MRYDYNTAKDADTDVMGILEFFTDGDDVDKVRMIQLERDEDTGARCVKDIAEMKLVDAPWIGRHIERMMNTWVWNPETRQHDIDVEYDLCTQLNVVDHRDLDRSMVVDFGRAKLRTTMVMKIIQQIGLNK